MKPTPGERCPWAGSDPLYVSYHDEEWGRGETADHALFEKIVLEGFQAGLSWITVLRKRERFREVFAGFDPKTVAAFGDREVDLLLADAGIIRHRGKIEAAIGNAGCALRAIDEYGSLGGLVWPHARFGAAAPVTMDDVPAVTEASTVLSRELKRSGWRFVGPTTIYAFMQAMGLVNDHLVGCPAGDAAEVLRRDLVP